MLGCYNQMSRDDVYNLLVRALWNFGGERISGDLQEISVFMKLEGVQSWDPAFKIRFDAMNPDVDYSISEALGAAAAFSRAFIVDWGVEGLDEFTNALERAARDPSFRPAFLE